MGLEYIHKHAILHRDIKPENLVFEENGYLRITDFGIARKWTPDNGKETSGTPGYMAPEVMCRKNHGIEVDYFALGIICFECMKGRVKIPNFLPIRDGDQWSGSHNRAAVGSTSLAILNILVQTTIL